MSVREITETRQGIFTSDVVNPVPHELQRKYFMRSRDPQSNRMRVVPEIRKLIEFRRLNLMEDFGMAERYDAIFCRNVIIYFDRPTQQRLFCKFADQLVSSGYMFIGHSESLHNLDVPLTSVAPALYRKVDGRNAK